MGGDDLFKRNRTTRMRRKTSIKDTRDRILIVCEGEKTEPQYFEGFGLTNETVVGTGRNTDSLVEYAISIKEKGRKIKENYDLLHFHYYDAAISREQYMIKLDSLLGMKYEKRCSKIFDMLFDKQDIAIKNAQRLLETYNALIPNRTSHQLRFIF